LPAGPRHVDELALRAISPLVERPGDELVRGELRPEIDRRNPWRRVEPGDLFAVEEDLDFGDPPLNREADLLIAGGQPEKER
jgi:hypothetical protein